MKPQEKTKRRIEIATKAVISALEQLGKNNGGYIVKRELFPHVVQRAIWQMDDYWYADLELEAIAPPTAQFIKTRWPEIILQAAEQKKYIVWSRDGVRLDTFEEFQKTREKMTDIAQGLINNIDGRNRIVVKQGGESYLVEINVKKLTSGIVA